MYNKLPSYGENIITIVPDYTNPTKNTAGPTPNNNNLNNNNHNNPNNNN